jgi:uncharacterized membrane protein
MILHVDPSAPAVLRALADTVLGLHIGGAIVGLSAGTVAMVARKGERLHRLAGETFFFAMMTMAGIGAVVAPMIGDIGSAFGGGITFYLVLTGWLAGRHAEVKAGRVEIAGVALLAMAILVVLFLGRQALASPERQLAGVPWFAFFVLATLAGLIAALDLKVIRGPVLVGPARLARHIWRMGAGLLVGLMSGLAQPKVGGVLFHGATTNLQWLPVGLLVFAIAYWMIRVRRPGFLKSHKPTPASRRVVQPQGVLT